VEIREIKSDEVERAGEVVVAAYQALEGAPPIDENGYANELRAVARRAREAVVLVAVDNADELVGCVTYVPDDASPFAEGLAPGEASMRMLGVAPDARRRGMGRSLVEACIARARAEGRERVFIHSGTWMREAHAMYESLGFVRVPERDWTPVPDVPLYGFALDLATAPREVDR